MALAGEGDSAGKIYLETHADNSKLAPELEAGAKEAAAAVGDDKNGDLAKAGERVGTRMGDSAGKSFGEEFVRDANGRLRTLDGRFANEAKTLGEKIGNDVADGNESTLRKRIGKLGGLLAPDWIKSIAVWIAALAPAAVELASVLVPAAGLVALIVPAAIGAAASLGILKIAFAGVGKAITDINGPAKTFDADLAKLNASQRAFVMEVKGIQPQLKAFKNNISQNFFADFSGSVTELGKKLLPGVSKSLGFVAETLGEVGKKLADVLTKKSSISDLNQIFFGFGSAVDTISDALPKVADALLKIGVGAAPYLDQVASSITKMATEFDKFITTAINDGAFNRFIQNAFIAFGKIEAIGKDVYTIISSIFRSAAQTGGGDAIIGKLGTIADVFKKLSDDGGLKAAFDIYNSFFSTLGKLIGPLIGPLSTFLKLLGVDLAKDIHDLLPGLLALVNNGLVPLFPALDNVLSVLNPVVDGVAKLLSAILIDPTATKIVVDSLIAFFISARVAGLQAALFGIAAGVSDLAGSFAELDIAFDANPLGVTALALGATALAIYEIWKYASKLVDKLGGWGQIWKDIEKGVTAAYDATKNFIEGIGSDIADFFTQTIPAAFNNYVVPFFEALPGVLYRFFKMLLSDTLFGIGEFIGLIFVAIEKLPGFFRDEFNKAAIWVGQEFHKMGDDALGIIDDIVAFFKAAPGRIGNALSALPGVLVHALARAWHDGKIAAESGIRDVIDDVEALPGKLKALGPELEKAGKALVTGFLHGLEDVAGLIKGVAGDIVDAIKNGLNKAIDKINSGINSIASTFFISVPNIPRLARGDYITKPTVALIGERNPEVVLPTDNPARAMQLLNQSGLAASLNMGAPDVYVNVTIGQQPINDIVDTRVEYSNQKTAQQLAYGTRG